jgi:hypothetical protein
LLFRGRLWALWRVQLLGRDLSILGVDEMDLVSFEMRMHTFRYYSRGYWRISNYARISSCSSDCSK